MQDSNTIKLKCFISINQALAIGLSEAGFFFMPVDQWLKELTPEQVNRLRRHCVLEPDEDVEALTVTAKTVPAVIAALDAEIAALKLEDSKLEAQREEWREHARRGRAVVQFEEGREVWAGLNKDLPGFVHADTETRDCINSDIERANKQLIRLRAEALHMAVDADTTLSFELKKTLKAEFVTHSIRATATALEALRRQVFPTPAPRRAERFPRLDMLMAKGHDPKNLFTEDVLWKESVIWSREEAKAAVALDEYMKRIKPFSSLIPCAPRLEYYERRVHAKKTTGEVTPILASKRIAIITVVIAGWVLSRDYSLD